MDNNISQASLLEVAIMLMKQKHTKQNIKKLISEVLEMKGLDDEDKTLATQLYVDITTSSKFVYMGNEEWDLKDRQPLDQWDKDGSAFNTKEEIVEEDVEDDFDFDDEDFEDEDELEDDELDEDELEDIYIDDDLDLETDDSGETLERYTEDDFDEDKYNNLMDDFEDMYEN